MRITTDFDKKDDGLVQASYFNLDTSDTSKPAIVITYRNVATLPATRVDDFPTVSEALQYIRKIEPTCPRISLDGKSLEPTPTWQEHLSWLHERGLRSATEGNLPMPDWAKDDATAKEMFIVNPKGE